MAVLLELLAVEGPLGDMQPGSPIATEWPIANSGQERGVFLQ